jgi:formate dehydrogenase-N alpha subunit
MKISRKDFLKISGSFTVGMMLIGFPDPKFAEEILEAKKDFKLKYAKETTTICPYCGVGCGILVATREGKVINTEGDPDHPINKGALCSKGSALYQVAVNERRLDMVLYRAKGSDTWEEKDWEWAISEIAKRVKTSRDASFVSTYEDGTKVNRTEGIACLGGAALDNEECYLLTKMMRAMGITYLEHQARLCHSSSVASLAASFGRGAMTNHFIDVVNADVIVIMGSNVVENHPITTKWINRAKDHGAVVISVDPRYSRSSSIADIYAPMRSGTDIAFVNGIINYALQNNFVNKDYILTHTNAPFIIKDSYDFKDGLFSGFDTIQKKYDSTKWGYELDEAGIPNRDETLQHPRCVYQLMRKHFSRYDAKKVCSITGTPEDVYLKICNAITSTSVPDRVATWLYAMGTTQHSYGTQNIRTYAILQLLMGNIGMAGGGINALRGESNVQGSTDHALLFHLLPGYLRIPDAKEHPTLKAYLEKITPKTNDPKSANWWGNTPKYVVSLLKAWWGENAQKESDFCFDYLPKNEGDRSFIKVFHAMYEGKIKGLFLFGQNPVVGGPNTTKTLAALEKLDWMVAVDLWQHETSTFWKRPGANPSQIKTEVFLLPAASSMEKEGSITNSGRWAQWRYKGPEPVGKSMSDLWIMDRLLKKIRQFYKAEGGASPDPILTLNWDYGEEEPDVHKVAKEINGYFVADTDFKERGTFQKGQQVPSFAFLTDDGSTACGNWLYSGSYTDTGNMMARRNDEDAPNKIGLYPNWAWCWPVNRRIIYNRASCDENGKPYNPKRWVVQWNADEKKWIGDVPDGPWANSERYAFIMRPEGVACFFASSLADGPFPEHFEPLESPVNNIMSSQQFNPIAKVTQDEFVDRLGTPEMFPIVATTFRVSEHWQAGAMTRNLPWLAELMPDLFVEISEELAKDKGIANGDRVIVNTARGSIEGYAVVTNRFKPLLITGKLVHQLGLPWHYGYEGLAKGDIANNLTHNVGDANTHIPEYKTFLCDLKKA